jgi:hypothetical protein
MRKRGEVRAAEPVCGLGAPHVGLVVWLMLATMGALASPVEPATGVVQSKRCALRRVGCELVIRLRRLSSIATVRIGVGGWERESVT